jgi:osmotically-inducible protein OsmY
MKGLFIFLLGLIVGAGGLYYYQTRELGDHTLRGSARRTDDAVNSTTDQVRDSAGNAKDHLSDKLSDWHLSGSDIRDDLQRTGQVVRSKAEAAGSSIASATANARIIAVIKAKYTLDKELSARTIDVSVDTGVVTLKGTAPSEALIGKAVAFALDTDGVNQVKSTLTVQPN